ncbi:MAG: hypothetical protein JST59_19970 [Actinobacteria bacterium]|nr:hypothetical protein [Actinomycetota bacterium]
MAKGRQEPAGRFGSEAVPMRLAGERTAAREREDRLSLVIRRPGRGVRIALALGAILIVLAVVVVLGRA